MLIPRAVALVLVLTAFTDAALSETRVVNNSPGIVAQDNYIKESEPTQNCGGETLLKLDNSPVWRGLVRVDHSFVPPAVLRINEANLSMKTIGASSERNVILNRVNESWDEGTATPCAVVGGSTWNNRTSTAPWSGGPGGGFDADPTTIILVKKGVYNNFTVTQSVRDFYSGMKGNFGFMLGTDTGFLVTFHSAQAAASGDRPLLVVNYTTVPANPTGLIASPGTSAINWTWTNPPDNDLAGVQVFINGTLAATILSGFFSAPTEPPGCREISLRAVNVHGDTANGFVNNTACALDLAPPGPATNIRVEASDFNFITWAWDNPADADLAFVDVFLDGLLNSSLPAPASSLNQTGLSQDEQHRVHVRTRDGAGNRGQNATNSTKTPACEQWACVPYEVCLANGTHSRACVDARACGTIVHRPELSSACIAPERVEVGGNVTGFMTMVGVALANVSAVEFVNRSPTVNISEILGVPEGVAPLAGAVPFVLDITTAGPSGNDSLLHVNVERNFVDSRGLGPGQVRFFAHNAATNSWDAAESFHIPAVFGPVLSHGHGIKKGVYHYHVIPPHYSLFAPAVGTAAAPGGGGTNYLPAPCDDGTLPGPRGCPGDVDRAVSPKPGVVEIPFEAAAILTGLVMSLLIVVYVRRARR